MPLSVGGGMRTADDARALLRAGADKVSLNTAAVEDPEPDLALRRRLRLPGGGCGHRRAPIRPGLAGLHLRRPAPTPASTPSPTPAPRPSTGAGEILLTSMDRDGAKTGYDLELLRAVSSAVDIPVIASGGAGNAEHLVAAIAAGADAVLAASIFHFGEVTIARPKRPWPFMACRCGTFGHVKEHSMSEASAKRH